MDNFSFERMTCSSSSVHSEESLPILCSILFIFDDIFSVSLLRIMLPLSTSFNCFLLVPMELWIDPGLSFIRMFYSWKDFSLNLQLFASLSLCSLSSLLCFEALLDVEVSGVDYLSFWVDSLFMLREGTINYLLCLVNVSGNVFSQKLTFSLSRSDSSRDCLKSSWACFRARAISQFLSMMRSFSFLTCSSSLLAQSSLFSNLRLSLSL